MAAFDPKESVLVKIGEVEFAIRAGTVREWREYERKVAPLLNSLATEGVIALVASMLVDPSQATTLGEALDAMRVDEFYRLANNLQGRVTMTLLEKKASA